MAARGAARLRQTRFRHFERSEKSLFPWSCGAARAASRGKTEITARRFLGGAGTRSGLRGDACGERGAAVRAVAKIPERRAGFFVAACRWNKVFRRDENDSVARHQRNVRDRSDRSFSGEKCSGWKIFTAGARDLPEPRSDTDGSANRRFRRQNYFCARKQSRRATPRAINVVKTIRNSYTRSGLVRPFQLNRAAAEDACFPRANVPDLPVVVVVPTLAGHRVRDCFAKFVRRRGSERVGDGQAAGAPRTTGVRHDRVENVAAGRVVIAAEILAGSAAALHYLHAGRKKNEVKRVGVGCGKILRGDFLLQQLLNLIVLHGSAWRG